MENKKLKKFENVGGSSLFLISPCKKYIFKKIRDIRFVKKNNEIDAYEKLSVLYNFKHIIPRFYGKKEDKNNYYMIIENLNTHFHNYEIQKPAIIDFKIGLGEHKFHSHTLKGKQSKFFSENVIMSIKKGIQLHGLKNGNNCYDKKYGKTINYNYDSLKDVLNKFLADGNLIRYDLLPIFIDNLTVIANSILKKDPLFDTSVLLFWKHNTVLCRLIDFGKYNCHIYKQFYPNEIYNFDRGVYYLVDIMKSMYKEYVDDVDKNNVQYFIFVDYKKKN